MDRMIQDFSNDLSNQFYSRLVLVVLLSILIVIIFSLFQVISRPKRSTGNVSLKRYFDENKYLLIQRKLISSQKQRMSLYGIYRYFVVIKNEQNKLMAFDLVVDEKSNRFDRVEPSLQYCERCNKIVDEEYQNCPDCSGNLYK